MQYSPELVAATKRKLMESKQMKGQALKEIPNAALLLGIAVVVVALMITVISGLATSVCTQNDGVEGSYINSSSTNPITSSYLGCCSGINASDIQDCNNWTISVALNSTQSGITGLGTFNDFWSVLVLIVILSVVIVALYAVFPRRAGY